jgi:hypothetical protein
MDCVDQRMTGHASETRSHGLRNSEVSFILDGLFPLSGQERTVRAQDLEEVELSYTRRGKRKARRSHNHSMTLGGMVGWLAARR